MKISDISIGDVFATKSCGSAVVMSVNDDYTLSIRFLNTNCIIKSSYFNVVNGSVKDPLSPSVRGVGFIGCGRYTRSKDRKAYSRWYSMIGRCYQSSYSKSNKSYSNVSVCDEWHNFQNFAEWFYSTFPNDGCNYELDKDVKCGDLEKVYSPDTCTWLKKSENSSIGRVRMNFKSPDGEIVKCVKVRDFCEKYGLSENGIYNLTSGRRKSHKGWTVHSDCPEL